MQAIALLRLHLVGVFELKTALLSLCDGQQRKLLDSQSEENQEAVSRTTLIKIAESLESLKIVSKTDSNFEDYVFYKKCMPAELAYKKRNKFYSNLSQNR